MQRVSSSATLILKFFIPTFWIVFFGMLTISLWFVEFDFYGRIPKLYMQLGMTTIYLLVVLLLWKTIMGLKRVEMDENYVYSTNYFKTFRYPYKSIEKVSQKNYLFFRTLSFYLNDKGSFGKKFTCLQSQKLFDDFIKDHPRVAISLGVKPNFDN